MKFFSKLKNVLYYVVLFGLLLQNSAFATLFTPTNAKAGALTVVLNEFLADPNTGEGEFVEIYNTTNSPIDISGWYVTDSNPTQFGSKIPTETLLSAYDYYVFEVSSGTTILNNGGDTVNLYNSGDVLIDAWTYGSSTKNMTIGRYPDGATWTNDLTPTKGLPNQLPDTTNPTSDILFPDDGFYNSSVLTEFNGTASDNVAVDYVNLKIKRTSDSKFWSDATNDWVSDTNTWNQVDVTDASNVNWKYTVNPLTNFDEGETYDIKTKAVDTSGNTQSTATVKTITIDNTAPAGGSFKIDGGKQVTSDQKVNLNLSYDNKSDVNKVVVSNDNFATSTEFTPEDTLKKWLLSDGEGMKTVYVKYLDKAGNATKLDEKTIYFSGQASDITKTTIKTGTKSYQLDTNVIITVDASAKTTVTFAKYFKNPEGATNFTPFGGFFDITFEDGGTPPINYPVYVQVYYTKADLENAGKTDESQIKGLYYYDTGLNTWKLYPKTGVDTANTGGYEGFVWANVDHLTPLVMGADTIAPEKPSNFQGVGSDGKVKLTWDKVSDAKKYELRYRQTTSFDPASTYSDIVALTDTETEITNLENGINYEFNVRAIDDAGNKGEWAIVVASPEADQNPTDTSSSTTNANYAYYYGTGAGYTTDATGSTVDKKDETKSDDDEEIITEGEVKSEDDTEGETQGARTAVTLGIIIIAIGAALGGYYGYQWWLGEGEVEEEELLKETKKPKDKKNKSNRRW